MVMIIALDNGNQIRYYRECYMIRKQYKEQALQSEKQTNFTYGWRACNGNSKKQYQTNSFEEFLKTLVCRFAYSSFPFTDLLSSPGLSLSFQTFCSPFPRELPFFLLVNLVREASTDLGSGSLFHLFPQESVCQHNNFSHTFIKLGSLSPYPSPTTTWGISISIKLRAVAVFFILHSRYSYIRWGTGWMSTKTLKISLLSSSI